MQSVCIIYITLSQYDAWKYHHILSNFFSLLNVWAKYILPICFCKLKHYFGVYTTGYIIVSLIYYIRIGPGSFSLSLNKFWDSKLIKESFIFIMIVDRYLFKIGRYYFYETINILSIQTNVVICIFVIISARFLKAYLIKQLKSTQLF